MKTFLLSLLGMALTIGGVYIMYVYIISIDTQANILFLIVSLVLIAGGVFLLIFAEKLDTIILKRVSKPEKDTSLTLETPTKKEGISTTLEKNNDMLKDWKKTNETKERLKMLEMSASDE